MIEHSASGGTGNGGLRLCRLVLLTALLGLAACVSDALPRDDDNDGGTPRRDASSDMRDRDSGDAARADGLRIDAQDVAVTADGDSAANPADAGAERPVVDASVDASIGDAADAADGRGPDAIDVTTDPGVTDAPSDVTSGDTDAAFDAATIDIIDSGSSVDTSDSGGANDVGDPDGSTGVDASDAGSTADATDARDGMADSTDGGVVVFFREDFVSDIGVFTRDPTVCGTNAPVWSNASGYAHASEPTIGGASRIMSPVVTVPANLSNIRLRMSHRYNTEPGFDAGQLFVSINGLSMMHVTTYVTGGYTGGGNTDPNSCTVSMTGGQFPGWSGNQSEFVSEVNLSAAPFDVAPNDTVRVVFRMTSDLAITGAGWDINWVTLSGTSP
jgi:hypothetical protein